MSWFDGLLYPIMVIVAWLMVKFHSMWVFFGLSSESGTAWTLSIVCLVITIRIVLIPLFVKQIRASRGMQLLAPDMQAIQKKYKGKTDPASREAMSRETMALYKKHGTNPFASCLPILAQSPIFFALFRVLNSLGPLAAHQYPKGSATPKLSIGPLTDVLAGEAEKATIFGAPLSGTFMTSTAGQVKLVALLLIVAMSATTFLTQRQLTMKNMPPAALEGPMAQQQKMLLYVMPLIFAFSGINFPIGVLIYWTTTNIWSMGQQFYTIRRMPAPGSQAELALKARQARKAAARGVVLEADERPVIDEKPRGQRVQPKRKDRARPKALDGLTDGDGSGAASGPADSRSTQDAISVSEADRDVTVDTAKGPVPRKPRTAGAGGSGKTGAPRAGGAERPRIPEEGDTAKPGTPSAPRKPKK